MREIEEADFILAIGTDPVNEAPMLALAMRQAFRRSRRRCSDASLCPCPALHAKGNAVAVLDPRPVSLPLEFIHLPIPPADFDLVLSMLMKRTVSRSVAEGFGPEARKWFRFPPAEYPFDEPLMGLLSGLEQASGNADKPVIVCGTDMVGESTIDLAADFALLLKAAKGWAGLFYLMPAANTFGAALFSSSDSSLVDIIEGVEKGTVKALVAVENDPFWQFSDQERLKRALR